MSKRGSEVCTLAASVITLRLPNVLALLVVLAGLAIGIAVSRSAVHSSSLRSPSCCAHVIAHRTWRVATTVRPTGEWIFAVSLD
jgi:hypothetical protein